MFKYSTYHGRIFTLYCFECGVLLSVYHIHCGHPFRVHQWRWCAGRCSRPMCYPCVRRHEASMRAAIATVPKDIEKLIKQFICSYA